MRNFAFAITSESNDLLRSIAARSSIPDTDSRAYTIIDVTKATSLVKICCDVHGDHQAAADEQSRLINGVAQ